MALHAAVVAASSSARAGRESVFVAFIVGVFAVVVVGWEGAPARGGGGAECPPLS